MHVSPLASVSGFSVLLGRLIETVDAFLSCFLSNHFAHRVHLLAARSDNRLLTFSLTPNKARRPFGGRSEDL